MKSSVTAADEFRRQRTDATRMSLPGTPDVDGLLAYSVLEERQWVGQRARNGTLGSFSAPW